MAHTDASMDLASALQIIKQQRAEIARLNSKLASSSESDDDAEQQPFRILDLPRELRNAIYELCVAPGKVYLYPKHCFKTLDLRVTPTERAERQLFFVNKQISREAQEIYYSKNLFVLLPAKVADAAECLPRQAGILFPNDTARKYIRRVSIALDHRQTSTYYSDVLVTGVRPCIRLLDEPDSPDGTPFERERHDHANFGHVRCTLRQILDAVNGDSAPRLDYLQVNLQNCSCDTGCHRKVNDAFYTAGMDSNGNLSKPIVFEELNNKGHKCIEFLGTVSDMER